MDGSLSLVDGFVAAPYRFLWHAASRTAILADLHLGAEVGLARQGLHLPDISSKAIYLAFEQMIARGPARVIIAGDLFDVPDPDAEAIAQFENLVSQIPADCAVIAIPGNHDPAPETLSAMHRRVEVAPAASVGGFTIFHGHRFADATEMTPFPAGMIVGHQHPAVILANRVQSAKMVCFVTATVRLDHAVVPLIVLPAFSPLPLGSNLLTRRNWILDLPRPREEDLRIAGLIEKPPGPCVLDFGPLSGLS
jgi:putative SbcD/Mre11-related phosphoesterase